MIFLDFKKAFDPIDVFDNNDHKELFYRYFYSPSTMIFLDVQKAFDTIDMIDNNDQKKLVKKY